MEIHGMTLRRNEGVRGEGVRGGGLTAAELQRCPGLAEERLTEALALVGPAAAWVEENYRVILMPAEFTQCVPRLPAEIHGLMRIALLAGPVAGITRMRVGARELAAGRVQAGWLCLEEIHRKELEAAMAAGGGLTMEFLAGFEAGKLPHLVKMALGLIVRHWLDAPEDRALGELGTARGNVEQFLEHYRPRGMDRHIMQRKARSAEAGERGLWRL